MSILEQYGTLVLSTDGSGNYSFTLDNSSAAVQGLDSTDDIKETLYYTIKDADGDTKQASLIIEIKGADDSSSVAVAEGSDTEVLVV